MANEMYTTAETNLITATQMTKAREIDFVNRFAHDGLANLMKILGVTRKIPCAEGTTLYAYTTSGTLESGNVAEGNVIPLSQYQRDKTAVGEITLKKWRKAASAEAIKKSGYNEAVIATDKKLLSDVQKGIRSDFFDFLGDVSGTTSVTETTLQMVLAKCWGNLQVLFEDDAVEAVHFVNPLTISDYLGAASITIQTAFGLNYIADFLGLGTVILSSLVPEDTVYSTAKENLIVYYLTMNGDIANAFGLTADETGFIGIKSGYANEERAQIESLVMSGVSILVEYAAGIVVGEVGEASDGEGD